MILYVLLIVILSFIGIRLYITDFNHDYISKTSIQPIKGIFLLLVFISHFSQYVQPSGEFDTIYLSFRHVLGQLVVSPFLFYSGYGIMESINKKEGYMDSFIKNRFVKTLIRFDIAVLLYLLVDSVLGKSYSARKIIFALTGWESIGNSNWFILATLILYLITYFSFTLIKKNSYCAVTMVTALSVITVYILSQFKDAYYYNTMLAFSGGMWYSLCRDKIEAVLFKSNLSYYLFLMLLLMLSVIAHKYWYLLHVMEILSILFALSIVTMTMKFQINNKFLCYCGEHLFSLFVLQRIPMLFLRDNLSKMNWVYLIVCFASTFVLSYIYDSVLTTPSFKMTLIKDTKRHKFLFEELVKRDFKKKYKRTVLGMAWSILSPLLTLMVMRIVFTRFFGRSTLHYTTYLFCGNLIFSYFNESTSQGMASLMNNSAIFTKVNIPKWMFLLSKNVQTLINFGLTLCVFIVFCFLDHITFTWKFIFLLYPIVFLVLFNIGVGMILSALFVFFRDIQYLWSVFTQLLMYLSVIFYNIDGYAKEIQRLFLLNPVYVFIKYFRTIVLDSTIPPLWFHGLLAVYAIIVLKIGCHIYQKYNHEFLYYV